MKHIGPSKRRVKRDIKKETQNMIDIAKSKTPTYKPRKGRGKDKVPRDMAEAKFRNEEVLPYLRKMRKAGKVLFYRIENGLPGYKGISDFLIFSFITNKFIFCELKSETGTLSDHQVKFKDACRRCGIIYVIARKLIHVKMWVEKA